MGYLTIIDKMSKYRLFEIVSGFEGQLFAKGHMCPKTKKEIKFKNVKVLAIHR